MAASINIDVFRVDGIWSTGYNYITIAPVITLTTDGGTHCDNSKLVVTYSGTRFSGSNTSYVTAASGVTKMHIYGDKKQSSIAQSNFSGSVTVSASLETSDGTIKASKTVSFSETTDSSNFNHFASFSASSTAEDHKFYLGTQIKVRLTPSVSLYNNSNIKYDIYWGSAASSELKYAKISDGVGVGEWYWTPSVEEYGNLIPSNSTSLSNTGFYAVARLDNGYELYRLPGIYPFVYLPESVVPSISSFLVEDVDGYLAEFGGYLQNYSHIKVSATYAGLYNATITSAKVTFDGTTIDIVSGTPVQWTDPVGISGERPVSISVTDSRGRVSTSSTDITVLPYVAPSFDSFLAQRWDATEGTETDYSTTVRLSCDGSIPAINGHAVTGTIAVQGRKKGDESWSDIGSEVSISGTFSEMFTAVDQTVDSIYNYRAFLTDRFGTIVMLEASVGTASPIMEFHASGKGIGIGTVAPENGVAIELPITSSGVYPVGSVIIRYDHISPASLYGGVWERIEGRFLYAIGESGTIGATGGSDTHTLTIDEMPAHGHGWRGVNSGTTITTQYANYPFDIDQDKKDNWPGTSRMILSTGGGKAHNNNPAFINVSVWRRVE